MLILKADKIVPVFGIDSLRACVHVGIDSLRACVRVDIDK